MTTTQFKFCCNFLNWLCDSVDHLSRPLIHCQFGLLSLWKICKMIASVSTSEIMGTRNFIRFWLSSNDHQKPICYFCGPFCHVPGDQTVSNYGCQNNHFSLSFVEMTHTWESLFEWCCAFFNIFGHFFGRTFDCWTSQFDCVHESAIKVKWKCLIIMTLLTFFLFEMLIQKIAIKSLVGQ